MSRFQNILILKTNLRPPLPPSQKNCCIALNKQSFLQKISVLRMRLIWVARVSISNKQKYNTKTMYKLNILKCIIVFIRIFRSKQGLS